MLKIPNYNVVVPTVPDLRLFTKRRTTYTGDRRANVYDFVATETVQVELPWLPVSREWVEVYIDGVRLINPRIKSIDGGTLYEAYNVENNSIRFTKPITGSVKVICDTQATPWYAALKLHAKNVQAYYSYVDVKYFEFIKWPVTGGSVNGFTYRVFYEPGPEFQANSYVIVEGCRPEKFNGNFKVVNGTLGSVTFRGNVAARDSMLVYGTISGFGNAVVKQTEGIALYSEPVIITQPYHGYARLSADRKNIVYVPEVGYTGNDTFSWSMINQHGQIGDPKCVSISVLAN